MSQSNNSLIADDDESDDLSHAAQAGLFGDPRDTDSNADSRDTETARAKPRHTRSKVFADRPPAQPQDIGMETAQDDDGGEPQDDPLKFVTSQDLPPLPGNVQLYVRMSIQGVPDWDNVRNYLSRGWKPRTRDTVPEGYSVGSRKVAFDELEFGNVVCNRDRILMERPRLMDEREKARDKAMQSDINSQIRGLVRDSEQYGLASGVETAKVGTLQDGVFRF